MAAMTSNANHQYSHVLLRFARAKVAQKTFPSLPKVGNMTKHRQK